MEHFVPSLAIAQHAVPDVHAMPQQFELLSEQLHAAALGEAAPPADLAPIGRRPDAHSRYMPDPTSTVDLDEVRVALGEKLFRTLAGEALRCAVVSPQSKSYQVLKADGTFVDRLVKPMITGLDLDSVPDAKQRVLDPLGKELLEWVKSNPAAAIEAGYVIQPDNSVNYVCPSRAPSLTPLEP